MVGSVLVLQAHPQARNVGLTVAAARAVPREQGDDAIYVYLDGVPNDASEQIRDDAPPALPLHPSPPATDNTSRTGSPNTYPSQAKVCSDRAAVPDPWTEPLSPHPPAGHTNSPAPSANSTARRSTPTVVTGVHLYAPRRPFRVRHDIRKGRRLRQDIPPWRRTRPPATPRPITPPPPTKINPSRRRGPHPRWRSTPSSSRTDPPTLRHGQTLTIDSRCLPVRAEGGHAP